MTITSESRGAGVAVPRPVRLRVALELPLGTLSGPSVPRLRFAVVRSGAPLSVSESSITIGSSSLEDPGVVQDVTRAPLGAEVAEVAEARALPLACGLGIAAAGGGGGGGRA